QFIGDEAWLVGLHIPEYAPASINAHEPDRTRKLLLHRREIERVQQAVAQKSLAVVLISLYFNADGRVKARLGLGRGKTQYDKRQSLREREDRREADRAMKAARRR
ncbi:MAG: SsrA-binding protein, partial [Thermoleophilia bacterium]|nr:SsrA-binding protein [Thermoleophilia bacterium]